MKRVLTTLVLSLIFAALVSAPKKAQANTNVANEAELRSAFEAPGNDTIVMTADIDSTATIAVTTSKTLDFNGHTLNDKSSTTAITVSGSGVTLTIKDSSGTDAGKIEQQFSNSVKVSTNGGAIHLSSSAALKMYSGTISAFYSSYGGAIYIDPGCSAEIYGGEIWGCKATYYGGGIYNSGTLTMTGGKIDQCLCGNSYKGGGVYHVAGAGQSFFMSGNVTIDSNFMKKTSSTASSDNVYLSDNSSEGGRIILIGELTGSVGVEAGGTGDYVAKVAYSTSDLFVDNLFKNSEGRNIKIGKIYAGGDVKLESNPVADVYDASGTYVDTYPSISAAVWACNDGYTIKLMRDYRADSTVVISKGSGTEPLTLDLNGYTFTSDASGPNIEIESGNCCILTDTSAGHTGKITRHAEGSHSVGRAISLRPLSSKLIIQGGTITGCSATKGGGIYVDFGSELVIDGGTITGCSATFGGAIYTEGNCTINGGTIAGCTANAGGGIEVYSGETKITGGTISGCTASDYGGGIYYYHGAYKMTGGIITGCTAPQGGGIQYGTAENELAWDFSVSGSATVTGNTCTGDGTPNNVHVVTTSSISARTIKLTGNFTGNIGINEDSYSEADHMGFTGTKVIVLVGTPAPTGYERFSFDKSRNMTVTLDESGNVVWKALPIPTPGPTYYYEPDPEPAPVVDTKKLEEEAAAKRRMELNQIGSEARAKLLKTFKDSACYTAIVSNTPSNPVKVTRKNGAYVDGEGNEITLAFGLTDKGVIFIAAEGFKFKKSFICAVDPDTDEVTTYYVNKKGIVVMDKVVTVSKTRKIYLDENGALVRKKWVTVGEHRYWCDKKGKITKTKKAE